jgi:hypothetical protein
MMVFCDSVSVWRFFVSSMLLSSSCPHSNLHSWSCSCQRRRRCFSLVFRFSCLYKWPNNVSFHDILHRCFSDLFSGSLVFTSGWTTKLALFREATSNYIHIGAYFGDSLYCKTYDYERFSFTIRQMPCIRQNHRDHRRFLPHFPPGPMRCQFSPELVPPLPHAMMEAFPKFESESTTYGSPTSPLSPLTQTSIELIPKPPGEVGRGGYTLKDLLEGQHEWKSGLYDKIRVFATCSHASIILRPLFRKGFAQWPTNT